MGNDTATAGGRGGGSVVRGRTGATMLSLAAVLLAAAGCGDRAEPPADLLRVGFIAPEGGSLAPLQGAELGAEEAAHAGSLVGRRFELVVEEADSPGEAVEAAGRLAGEGVAAVIGGFDAGTCAALEQAAERLGVLYLNVGCRDDALRLDTRQKTLHVEASQAMYEAGLGRFGREAVLWHGDLSRFGAAQLNERFVRRYGAAAESGAWASWMAVKVLWEAFTRAGSAAPDALLAAATAPEVRYDGHKGEPLFFDPRTRQLQQPLFARAVGGAGAGEVPESLARHAALPSLAGATLGAGPFLYVSNEGSVDVTVVDLSAGRAVARIPVARRPRGIHLDPAGSRLFVALSDDAPQQESDRDGVAVIDLGRGEEVGLFPVGSDPEQFAITPDGRLLYASNEDAGTATATELPGGRVVATVVVGIEPEGVAVSPDGRWIYVTAETSNTVSVIDTRSQAVVASFLVDVRPRGAAFSPAGDRAYVTNEISGTLSVVEVPAHRVIATVDLGGQAKPVGVVVSPDGRRVYVANGHGHSVAVIDAASSRVVAEVPTGRRPWGITISPDGSFVYTANGVSNDVSEISTADLTVTRTLPVGERPWGVAYRAAP